MYSRILVLWAHGTYTRNYLAEMQFVVNVLIFFTWFLMIKLIIC